MRIILLTNGGVTLVDDADYEALNAFDWQRTPQGYARRWDTKKRTVLMHREILGIRGKAVADHINMDTLDNRRENLRCVSRSVNGINRKFNRNNTSGFRNVTFRKDIGKWSAAVMRNRKHLALGVFATPEEAYKAVVEFKSTEERQWTTMHA